MLSLYLSPTDISLMIKESRSVNLTALEYILWEYVIISWLISLAVGYLYSLINKYS